MTSKHNATTTTRQIMSSKRSRKNEKKSKKLQALECQQAKLQEAASAVKNNDDKLVKTDDDKTDDDDDEMEEEELFDDDLIVIPRVMDACVRYAPKIAWTKDDTMVFELSIPSFHETDDGHIVYAIVIETPRHQAYTVHKRYSEFAAFAHALYRKDISWTLPPKTWFRVTQDAALVDRRERLEAACIDLVQRDELPVDELVREFFQLDLVTLP
ncbi:hypothetical protein AC1031_011564 [Aphanomyces cochlioides]|nr:hypothetical protein AC1031_011564 [Aphanomyces cochlioides]